MTLDWKDLKRFLNRVTIRAKNRCWEWTGSTHPDGYGWMKIAGVYTLTHRLAWIIHEGCIPDGMHVLHECDNPKCVNPRHLFLGTHAKNMQDMVEKGRAYRFKGSDNPNSKLQEKHVVLIRKIMANGGDRRQTAKKFSISLPQLDRITHKHNWTHI